MLVLFCVTGLLSAKFTSDFRQMAELAIYPTKPVFLKGNTWYTAKTTPSEIMKITVTGKEDAPESYIEVFKAGSDSTGKPAGTIKGYIIQGASGKELIITGDNYENKRTIYANADSSNMFSPFTNVISIIGLENVDTANVKSIASMFKGCSALQSLDLSPWIIAPTSMTQAFHSCSSLVSLNLSGFDTSNITNTTFLFQSCKKLKTIVVSDKFVTDKITNSTNMFAECNSLEGCHGTTLAKMKKQGSNDNLTAIYARIDTTNAPGYFTGPTVTVTYKANGGSGDDYQQYIRPDKEDHLISSTFIKPGYSVYAWNTLSDGSGTEYAPCASVSFSEDTDLYARWKPDTYTVSLDAQGGTVTPDSLEVIYDSPYGSIPDPEKDGCEFDGWTHKGLPDGYREVEYIESTGKEYIDTEYAYTNDTRFECKIMKTNAAGNQAFFGYRFIPGPSYAGNMRFFFITNSGQVAVRFGVNGDNSANTIKLNTPYVFSYNGTDFFVDGTKYVSLSSAYPLTGPGNAYIFFANTGSWHKDDLNQFTGRIYYFRIFKGNEVAREYIPVISPEGEYGLYDLVENRFYGNISGEGAFKGGSIIPDEDSKYKTKITPDTLVKTAADHTLYAEWVKRYTVTLEAGEGTVTPAAVSVIPGKKYGQLPIPERKDYYFSGWSIIDIPGGYTAVEYLESDGTAYIDTDYINSDQTSFECRIMKTNAAGNQAYFGYRLVPQADVAGDMRFFFMYEDGRIAIRYGVNADNSVKTINTNTAYDIKFDGTNIYVNDEKYASVTARHDNQLTGNAYLFRANTGSMHKDDLATFKGRIYFFNIYDGETLVRNFIPVKNPEGIYGMYDTVSGEFFGDASGQNAFTGGAAINPDDCDSFIPVTKDTLVTLKSDHTLTAIWAKQYEVTLDACGGTVQTDKIKVSPGFPYGNIPEPVRDGYTFAGWSDKPVPDNCRAVEYIESDGIAYIDTGYVYSDNTTYECRLMPLTQTNTGGHAFFGYRFVSKAVVTGNMRFFFMYDDGKLAIRYGVNADNSTKAISRNVISTLTFDGTTLKVDGVPYISWTAKDTSGEHGSAYLFRCNTTGSYDTDLGTFSGRLYYFNISDNGEPQRSFVPMKWKDGRIGLYDGIENKMYYNVSDKGTFTAGGESAFITSDTTVTKKENHTLYAVWDSNTDALTLDMNDPSRKDDKGTFRLSPK